MQNTKISPEQKEQMIKELAAHEHDKWSMWQRRIHLGAKTLISGELVILVSEIEKVKSIINLEYANTDNEYKKYVKDSVKGTIDIINRYNYQNELKISSMNLQNVLEKTEHNRIRRWMNYMLSLCTINDSVCTIPSAKYELWSREIITPYAGLTESQKNSDIKEVYEIFSAVAEFKDKFKENLF